jgi:hypothetical protein
MRVLGISNREIGKKMKAVQTNELEAGTFAAFAHDLPNCGGIQIGIQGEIVEVKHTDMWGTASEIQTTVYIRERGADKYDVKVRTFHNSHMWLVRTL